MVRELTEKQKNFCKNVVSGMTYKDSYISAYDTSCSDQVAYNESSKLMLRDDIQKEIKRISEPLEKAYQSTVLTEREKKRDILWTEIQNAREQQDHAAVARYMDILNKMDQEYINVNKSIEEQTIITEINTEALQRLVSRSTG